LGGGGGGGGGDHGHIISPCCRTVMPRTATSSGSSAKTPFSLVVVGPAAAIHFCWLFA